MATDHFSLFQEASRSPERPYRVILFADLSGSTEMKTKTGEVNWLPTIGKFLDITTEAITSHGGTVVKYLGDGTLAAFGSEHAADAINAAIRIQEMLRTENKNALKECLATIGIATGHVVEYEAPGGGLDYVGSVVDRAARLCSAGAPQAIWVDSATVVSANMLKVSSTLGRELDFGPDDYLTETEEKVRLKGFPEPVRYREVIWRQEPAGAKNGMLTEAIEKQEGTRGAGTQQTVTTAQPPLSASNAWAHQTSAPTMDGTVKRWDATLGRGFIATNSEYGDHYVDRRFIVGEGDLTEGRSVRFIPLPPLQEGKQPLAGCTVQEGNRIQGHFQRVFSDKGYSFVDVIDSRGNRQALFVHLGPEAGNRRPGDPAVLEVCRNYKGIAGQLIANGDADRAARSSGTDFDRDGVLHGEPA
ncbi:class 3 adenylate cyclase/cold shock CspA family protein [Streptomyces sp. V4I23]|uniref:adenylate/guanylate cyclase domain-containing protein n=1 Tax=Streptomyces sp. V4I23 TaxID=3042282 RepID=UPI002785E9FB|nr:adenylate/guanylate cyclase domain-containing protein [Streptomyces sp. V4I23]MDQ1013125.1 class 3 adenylate cyclase/cold shock CspA family protein [Streptomyces sp. V4I23]